MLVGTMNVFMFELGKKQMIFVSSQSVKAPLENLYLLSSGCKFNFWRLGQLLKQAPCTSCKLPFSPILNVVKLIQLEKASYLIFLTVVEMFTSTKEEQLSNALSPIDCTPSPITTVKRAL